MAAERLLNRNELRPAFMTKIDRPRRTANQALRGIDQVEQACAGFGYGRR